MSVLARRLRWPTRRVFSSFSLSVPDLVWRGEFLVGGLLLLADGFGAAFCLRNSAWVMPDFLLVTSRCPFIGEADVG